MTESSLVQGALATLRLDADPDVAYYASLAPGVLDDPNGDRVQTGNNTNMITRHYFPSHVFF